LNVHNICEVRHIQVHTAERLVPGPSTFEDEIAIAKMKKYELPGTDEIPVELIQAEGETLLYDIHKQTNKNKLHCLSPRANYTDRAAACRRSDCQLLLIKDATWSA
jgi:hypothetical protein